MTILLLVMSSRSRLAWTCLLMESFFKAKVSRQTSQQWQVSLMNLKKIPLRNALSQKKRRMLKTSIKRTLNSVLMMSLHLSFYQEPKLQLVKVTSLSLWLESTVALEELWISLDKVSRLPLFNRNSNRSDLILERLACSALSWLSTYSSWDSSSLSSSAENSTSLEERILRTNLEISMVP